MERVLHIDVLIRFEDKRFEYKRREVLKISDLSIREEKF